MGLHSEVTTPWAQWGNASWGGQGATEVTGIWTGPRDVVFP